jgi:hypothetical protein
MTRSAILVVGIVAVTAIVILGCLLVAGPCNAWLSLLGVMLTAVAFGLALLLMTALAVGAIASKRRLPWIGGLLAVGAVLVLCQWVSSAIAQGIREQEVQSALAAGLEQDCRDTFVKYRDDPRLQQDGYLRFFPDSSEFSSLPASIRNFRPCYVTVEDHRQGSPNVGLCKNGFGGFAFGVRVFMDADNIPETFWSKRMSRCAYLWQQQA